METKRVTPSILAAASILVLPFVLPRLFLLATVVVGAGIAWLLNSPPPARPRAFQEAAQAGAAHTTPKSKLVARAVAPTKPSDAQGQTADNSEQGGTQLDATPLDQNAAAGGGGTQPTTAQPASVKGSAGHGPGPGSLEPESDMSSTPAPSPAAAPQAPDQASRDTTASPAGPAPSKLDGGGAAPKAAAPPAAAGGAAILARLRAQRAGGRGGGAAGAAAGGGVSAPKPVTVLYGSQTGTAQEIAQNIGGRARELGLVAKVAALDEFGLDALTPAAVPVLVLVSSSTGDGDPPDNAARFYGQIKKRGQQPDRLKGMTFTVLGLGDSNYTQFCRVPRALRSQVLALGAGEFHPGKDADEVDGLEDVVEAWLDQMLPALKRACLPTVAAEAASEGLKETVPPEHAASTKPVPLPECRIEVEWLTDRSATQAVLDKEAAGATAEELGHRDPEGLYSPEQPFHAPLIAARWLTTSAAGDRRVLHCELGVEGSGARTHPGDSLGVKPANPPALVSALAARLGLEASAVFDVRPRPGVATQHLLPHLHTPCSIGHALTESVDIAAPPRKSLLRLLAEHCAGEEARQTLLRWTSRAGRDEYAKEVLEGRPSLLDLLTRFDSRPPLAPLLDALPALVPRPYSIANAAVAQPGKVAMALSIVRFTKACGTEHEGVATTWLERKAAPLVQGSWKGAEGPTTAVPRIPIYFRSGGAFRPPASLEGPLIMLGPGTGVAPFIGFLQDRRHRLAAADLGFEAGPSWLFFGCRHPDQDYLYKQELEEFEADGTLSRLSVAFSRQQARKVYVQHLVERHAHELAALLAHPAASIFVCGDGAGMAAGVNEALARVLTGPGAFASGADWKAGAAALAAMAREGRYVRDIWS
ncbi:hypothetical protein ACKKBF_B32860 [Auxenochlorella protothecoides x Auxenochlorella symbiontica]